MADDMVKIRINVNAGKVIDKISHDVDPTGTVVFAVKPPGETALVSFGHKDNCPFDWGEGFEKTVSGDQSEQLDAVKDRDYPYNVYVDEFKADIIDPVIRVR